METTTTVLHCKILRREGVANIAESSEPHRLLLHHIPKEHSPTKTFVNAIFMNPHTKNVISPDAKSQMNEFKRKICINHYSNHQNPINLDSKFREAYDTLTPYLNDVVVPVDSTLRDIFLSYLYGEVNQKFLDAGKSMCTTLKCPEVWRPCLFMYLSLVVSLNIHEGLFYWYTDSKDGPFFSKEAVGYIFSIGSVGALLGAILYQNILKEYPFRNLLFWTQLLYALSGMLDFMLVLRMNLKIGIPDYFFVVIDESVSQMIDRLKWMPLLVLSTKLCPRGIEGTFFALLMSIDNIGGFSSSCLVHLLEV
ncbi:probable folate-biopterin transporter 2 [Rutidosis leptorrhynchoides]|uniref:probable folate-biopterin transporter 2 n=1 Tax=Rutidosis leptorrhynchoides TaxID=125765 RepID=UPI003A98EF1F